MSMYSYKMEPVPTGGTIKIHDGRLYGRLYQGDSYRETPHCISFDDYRTAGAYFNSVRTLGNGGPIWIELWEGSDLKDTILTDEDGFKEIAGFDLETPSYYDMFHRAKEKIGAELSAATERGKAQLMELNGWVDGSCHVTQLKDENEGDFYLELNWQGGDYVAMTYELVVGSYPNIKLLDDSTIKMGPFKLEIVKRFDEICALVAKRVETDA